MEAIAQPGIRDLPTKLLEHILLSAQPTTNLLRHVAVCARVCPEWRRLVAGVPAYGAALEDRALEFAQPSAPHPLWPTCSFGESEQCSGERARVLRTISDGLDNAAGNGRLDLGFGNSKIGEEGGRSLGAALCSLPTPLRLTELSVPECSLTAAGLAPIVNAMRRGFAAGGLRKLNVSNNTDLRDDGIEAVAGVLPSTLQVLHIFNTGCGDVGMTAVAARLPSSLALLNCSINPDIGQDGWAALGAALPHLPALAALYANGCSGMGCGGVGALFAGAGAGAGAGAEDPPAAPALGALWVLDCNIGDEGGRALANALPRCPALQVLYILAEHARGNPVRGEALDFLVVVKGLESRIWRGHSDLMTVVDK
eukprot:COSAG04_NODE_260_length_18679_cov_4.566439_13_plen_368_part_00